MSNDNAQNTPDHRPAVGGPVERMVGPLVELTPWFPPGTFPVRDGVYLVSQSRMWGTVRSDCWHAFRWDCKARAWFSAESTGRRKMDLIGADRSNRTGFFWRGIAA